MFRKISGVVAGYSIFVLSSLGLFHFSRQNPHAEASLLFQILTGIYGSFFSALGGWVLQAIAGTRTIKLNYFLACIIAGFAAFSLVKATGEHWTQWLAIILFAPISIVGGRLYLGRR